MGPTSIRFLCHQPPHSPISPKSYLLATHKASTVAPRAWSRAALWSPHATRQVLLPAHPCLLAAPCSPLLARRWSLLLTLHAHRCELVLTASLLYLFAIGTAEPSHLRFAPIAARFWGRSKGIDGHGEGPWQGGAVTPLKDLQRGSVAP